MENSTNTPSGNIIPISSSNGEKKKPKKREGKRYVGVRQRPSGRWVAEIKECSQKLRLWLGTYDSAEEAAFAYDSAARLLRGSYAKTNFPISHHQWANQDHCSKLFKNPRLSHLLQHAILKKNHSTVLLQSCPNNHGKPVVDDYSSLNFDTLVQDTIVCSSSSSSSSPSVSLLGHHQDQVKVCDNNKKCGLISSFGGCRVYSSVIVAPSFSASLCQQQQQQQQDNCKQI